MGFDDPRAAHLLPDTDVQARSIAERFHVCLPQVEVFFEIEYPDRGPVDPDTLPWPELELIVAELHERVEASDSSVQLHISLSSKRIDGRTKMVFSVESERSIRTP